jgi:hypothetical protein
VLLIARCMKSTKIEVLKVPDNHALAAERYAGHKFNVGWFSVIPSL